MSELHKQEIEAMTNTTNETSSIPNSVVSIARRFGIHINDKSIVDVLTIAAQPYRERITGDINVDSALVLQASEAFAAALCELDAMGKQGAK